MSTAAAAFPPPPSALQPRALLALLRLSLAGLSRLRRLISLCLLFALPMLLAALPRIAASLRGRPLDPLALTEIEFVFAFVLLPHAVVPLAALLFGSGMINDEIEDQTLTYLLIRPLQRWSIYAVKLLASVLLVIFLCALFVPPLLFMIWWGQPSVDVPLAELVARIGRLLVICSLAAFAYTAIFGCLGILVRRILIVGAVYIIVFEGLLASIPFVLREFTVMYYLRVLMLSWLHIPEAARHWGLEVDVIPEAASCVVTLLVVGTLATAFACYLFSVREFRLKTPEGT
ncbi:MAG TPA: ABC transporter permease [Gemmatales bacterium]|nr:ABC transporter permease [Gemmatales bacterium]HMP60776.1 ABC transporter permease [Gemmatales bacterium]